MTQLIAVSDNANMGKVVSARDLHSFLGLKEKFTQWIKRRIKEYDFVENVDFTCLSETTETQTKEGKKGIAKSNEYIITLTMAKELAMVERNAKGKQARQYFIACEKQLLESMKVERSLEKPQAAKEVKVEKEGRVIRRVSQDKLSEMLYEMCFIKDSTVRVSLAKKLYEGTLC